MTLHVRLVATKNTHYAPPTKKPSLWATRIFVPVIQPLLLWQSLSLFWFCGLWASRFMLPALLTVAIIIFIDKRLHSSPRLFIACILFCAGIIAVFYNLTPRPSPPSWLTQNISTKNTSKHRMGQRIEGIVTKVQGLPDKRLRIFLRAVHPVTSVTSPSSATEKPTQNLPGLAIWTWDNPSLPRPIVGQSVQIKSNIYSTESFSNFGMSNANFYWQSQGVFWRLWSRGDYGAPKISGIPTFHAALRTQGQIYLENTLRHTVLDFSEPQDKEHNNTQEKKSDNIYPLLSQAKAFLPALLFGDKFYLSTQTIQNMSAASLIHSLALSGQHLGIAVFFAFSITLGIRYTFPNIFLHVTRIKCITFLSLPLALLYLWLGNAPPSLLRATLMLFLSCIVLWRNIVASLSDILFTAFLCITLYNPLAIFDLGLQLSVLCVSSIVLILPLLKRIPAPSYKAHALHPLRFFLYRGIRNLTQIFCISLTIQVALLPVALYYFAPSGAWFLCNVIWLPILGLWVLPIGVLGFLLACTAPILGFGYTAATLCCDLAAQPCAWLLSTLHWMDTHHFFTQTALLRPHWTSFIAWGALLIALALLIGRLHTQHITYSFTSKDTYTLPPTVTRLAFVAAILLCFGPLLRFISYWQESPCLTAIDVGNGQAIYLQLPGGESILIDGGGSFSTRFDPGRDIVIPSLTYNAPPRLFASINTHPDIDHMRGLIAVLQKIQITNHYDNGQALHPKEEAALRRIAQTCTLPPRKTLYTPTILPLPIPPHLSNTSFALEVLHPPANTHFTGNNASLILRLIHITNQGKQGLALLCGDAEKSALHTLLASQQDLRAHVLIMPHHGSVDALVPAFYDAVSPLVAIVSSGNNNSYGFPHYKIRQALHQRHIPLYNTAQDGAIRITWTQDPPYLHIHTAR